MAAVIRTDATVTHADGTVTLLTDFVNMVQEGTSALVGAIGSTLQSVPSYLAAIAPNVIADLAMGGDLEEVAERYAKIVGVTMGVDALGKLFGFDAAGDPNTEAAFGALKNGIIHFAVVAALNGSKMDGEDWGKLAANASMREAVGYAVQNMGGSMSIADLPLNCHPAAIRASAGFTPCGAVGATGDRRSWSGLRSRSPVAVKLAA